MANSLLTPTVIAAESLMQLRNNLVMGGLVHREYRNEFRKVGESIQIRRPVKFTRQSGATRVGQDVSEGRITLTLGNRHHVSWAFTTQDLTLTIEQYSERYVTPACIELANGVDSDLLALYDDVGASVGTPGTTPSSFMAIGDAAIKLDNAAAPDDGRRCVVLNPAAKWNMADALKGTFDRELAKDTVRGNALGKVANHMIYGDQNVALHTTGTDITDGTLVVDGAVSDTYSTTVKTSTLIIDGFTDATVATGLKAGDVFTIADVYSVNPRSRASTGELQQFVVTTDTAIATNEASCTIFPRIIASGAYQTVSAAAANNAAVTFIGTANTSYPQNMAFHRNAFALVFVPLELPRSATFKARSTMEGVSVRIVEDFDIDNDEEIIRLDVLNATQAIYEELACRIWG